MYTKVDFQCAKLTTVVSQTKLTTLATVDVPRPKNFALQSLEQSSVCFDETLTSGRETERDTDRHGQTQDTDITALA